MSAGWQAFAEQVVGATTQEDVLTALSEFLASHGYPLARCQVQEEAATDARSGDHTWRIPVRGTCLLVLEFSPPISEGDVEEDVRMAIALARARLKSLVDEKARWEAFTDILDRVGTARTEQNVFQELAAGLARLFDLPHVRILRYRPDADGLVLECGVDRGKVFSPASDRVMPLSDAPMHRRALEHGEAVHLDVAFDNPAVSAERDLLFPPRVARVAIVPFWMSTRDLGLVSLGEWRGESPERSSLFQVLLHHTALAVERVRLFEEVEAARKEADLILQKTFSGVMVLSPDLNVIRANPAAASLWDMRVEDILGRSARELFGPDVEDLFSARRNGHTNPLPFPREWRITTVTGEHRDVLVGVALLPEDEHAGWRGHLVTLVDVSQQRRLERLKQHMITNVTHEMRTPIAVIRGYVELLQNMGREADSVLWAQALATIEQRAKDLLQMVDTYIALSLLEAGEVKLRPTTIDVAGMVRTLWRESTTYVEQPPEFRVNVDDRARRIRVDSHLFDHIVRHLLDNALKFTPADGRVSVRAWAEGHDFHMEIADTGTGIPAQDLPHVFTPFYRGGNAGFGIAGSGMGLALVQAATRYLGGQISVESLEGRGTTFHIVLPGVIQNGGTVGR